MGYSSLREFMERVFVNGEEAEDYSVLATPFGLMLYDKTKDNEDFNEIWDSPMGYFDSLVAKNPGFLIGTDLPSEEETREEDSEKIMEALETAPFYASFTELEQKLGEYMDANPEADFESPQQAYSALLEFSSSLDFPWDNYIEYLRERLTNDGGG